LEPIIRVLPPPIIDSRVQPGTLVGTEVGIDTRMASRKSNRLTARMVEQAKEPGFYGDGGGLVLRVAERGHKVWLFRYKTQGKVREMGLGPTRDVSLAEARERAREARRLRRIGTDPIDAKRERQLAARLNSAKAINFSQCAAAYIENHRAAWSSAKHAAQWEATLRTYAYPTFGNVPVAAVGTALVVRALDPIWSKKPETASRVRGRIEAVLDFAAVRGYRVGENPARWKGHLKEALPPLKKLRTIQHHAALPYSETGAFLADLRTHEGGAAAALEFLTASRTAEVIGALWSEIDMTTKVWTIAADRMKSKIEHRVPLSEQALAVLRHAAVDKVNDVIFSGQKRGRALSNMALLMMLRRMGCDSITAHGFRSTFRDWVAEQTNVAGEVAEAALAHVVANKTEAAYRRSDLFEKRRLLMQQWGAFCERGTHADYSIEVRQGSLGGQMQC
jgi:integrase